MRRRARRLLDALGQSGAQLAILLTDDLEIRELNRVYRDRDEPTDVLSFPQMLEGESLPPGVPLLHLGDIAISLDTASRHARSGCLPRLARAIDTRGWTTSDEVAFLVVHGVLHLLGYDHIERAERGIMVSKEAEILPVVLPKRA